MSEFESMELDHLAWSGMSSDEIGYTADNLQITDYTYESSDGQHVDVVHVSPEGASHTVIVPASHNQRPDDFLKVQLSVIATTTESEVTWVGEPNIGNSPRTKLSLQAIKNSIAAFWGDYVPNATTQLNAINNTVGLSNGQDVRFLAFSQASAPVTGMLLSVAQEVFEPKVKVSAVDFIDNVNIFGDKGPLAPIKLASSLTKIEQPRRLKYLNENSEIGHGSVKPADLVSDEDRRIHAMLTRRQFLPLYFGAQGLRWGIHTPFIRAAQDRTADGIGLQDADISFYVAEDSTVSNKSDVESILELLNEKGISARAVEFIRGKAKRREIGHHILDSLGSLKDFALKKR
ncbi:hypothetical protein EPN95_02640 [Patescibacteria group bacterium]|nr:MAG: hypothetical protein EPN95_02640 [Patescibacteria group bacterium]